MELILFLLLAQAFAALAIGTRMSGVANVNGPKLGRIVSGLVGVQLLLAVLLSVWFAIDGRNPIEFALSANAADFGLNKLVYYDGVSALMLPLVSFIGWVVTRFSIRYLDGEANQAQYFRRLSFTIGAVSLISLSGNLAFFFLGWVCTSVGLHGLLMHYSDRRAAVETAWTKFVTARCGDALLLVAIVLIYQAFGTLDISAVLTSAQELANLGKVEPIHAAIAWLLFGCAMLKSVQFPFHGWLPRSMETPTPVSALMHAGIVNAGGFLIVRFSALALASPSAMATTAIIGALTACLAGLAMMTQTSIKHSLAYSTIAQMGFMMMQCGLGAFSAAMLHLVAHSIYKAYAFLNSGNILEQAPSRTISPANQASQWSAGSLALSVGLAAGLGYAASWMLGIDFSDKPSGFLLAAIGCMAIAVMLWHSFAQSRTTIWQAGVLATPLLFLVYLSGYAAVNWLTATSIVTAAAGLSPIAMWSLGALFILVFLAGLALIQQKQSAMAAAVRIHASNGFYIDDFVHRVALPVAKS